MKQLRKALIIVVMIIAGIIIAFGVLYAANGSLEMLPTQEQEEKIRIAALCIIAFGAVIEAAGTAALLRSK